MRLFESELQKEVERRFLNSLSKKNNDLSIKNEDKWHLGGATRYFDIVIYKGQHPYVLVEVKEPQMLSFNPTQAQQFVLTGLAVTNARFGVITDGTNFYLYDRNNREKNFQLIEFEKLIEFLLKPDKIKVLKRDISLVASIIHKIAKKYFNNNPEVINFLSRDTLIQHITFDVDSNLFYFENENQGMKSFENQLFNKMFGEFKETQLCRYTSLDAIFSSLNYISLRMNGLVGMNDKTEVNYVESYVSGLDKDISKAHHNTISALNRRYITSCTTIQNIDNLTLWRLYADDSKGVCIVYDINSKNLNQNVLIQKVKYADENGKHVELEFIKEIQNEVEAKTGFNFEFKKISVWKHFFKPFEYSIENEIRLLIIDNGEIEKIKTDWVLTYSHSILNPIIEFRLNHDKLPVQLSKIILGPKCPEQSTNKVQMEELLRSKNKYIKEMKIKADLSKIKVELSKIKNYR